VAVDAFANRLLSPMLAAALLMVIGFHSLFA
jgi:hypothetical protein